MTGDKGLHWRSAAIGFLTGFVLYLSLSRPSPGSFLVQFKEVHFWICSMIVGLLGGMVGLLWKGSTSATKSKSTENPNSEGNSIQRHYVEQ